jgi:predicted Zn-dependent protease
VVNDIYSDSAYLDLWSPQQAQNLTYCVSSALGVYKAHVLKALQKAAADWESIANVKFRYVESEDKYCNYRNSDVVFNVRYGTEPTGRVVARAFFPSSPRDERELIIFKAGILADEEELTGVLRHELGHTLGFRHEHLQVSGCEEGGTWRRLTAYDSASIMHYPHCNGTGDGDNLVFTELDKEGAKKAYPFE